MTPMDKLKLHIERQLTWQAIYAKLVEHNKVVVELAND